jgi:hypothetical protein
MAMLKNIEKRGAADRDRTHSKYDFSSAREHPVRNSSSLCNLTLQPLEKALSGVGFVWLNG